MNTTNRIIKSLIVSMLVACCIFTSIPTRAKAITKEVTDEDIIYVHGNKAEVVTKANTSNYAFHHLNTNKWISYHRTSYGYKGTDSKSIKLSGNITLKKISFVDDTINISIKKRKNTYYKIQVYSDEDYQNKICTKKVKKGTVKFTNVDVNTSYYCKIITYKKRNGKYKQYTSCLKILVPVDYDPTQLGD